MAVASGSFCAFGSQRFFGCRSRRPLVSAGSLRAEIAKGLLAAFVALVNGLIAAGIAWQRWRVARAKLKLDLFDRRLAIFRCGAATLIREHRRSPLSFTVALALEDLPPPNVA